MPTGIYKRTLEQNQKISESLKGINRPKGEDSFNWKGDNIGYQRLHSWLKNTYGKATKCERCGVSGQKRYEWANISGKYLRDIKDFIQLCCSCHRKMDYTDEHRRNLSLAHKGQKAWNKGRMGIRANISIKQANELKTKATEL